MVMTMYNAQQGFGILSRGIAHDGNLPFGAQVTIQG
jgi:hypothetical protein